MPMEDRRIRRTRKLLTDALVALIEEKEYENVTVQEITERADIGHRTFYRHYTCKDDLLIEVIKTALSGFTDMLVIPTAALLRSGDSGDPARENARRLFEYVDENDELFRVLFQRRPIVYQFMLDLARQHTTDLLSGLLDESDIQIPLRIIANHVTSSTFAMMKLWVEDEKPYSADVVGEYLVQMVFKPIRNFLSENG